MLEESANSRVAKNTLFMSVRMIIILLLQLYTTRVVLSSLGVVDYGVYNVVCGFVSMFSFLSTAMTNGIQRYYNYELGLKGESGIRAVFNSAIRVQIAVAIVLTIFMECIGIWYIKAKMVIPDECLFPALCVFQFSTISFVFLILQVPFSAIIIAKEKMDFYAIMSILNSVLILFAALFIRLSKNDKLILYGLLLMLNQLVILFIYIIYSKHITPSLGFDKKYNATMLKSMLSFSGWNVFGAFGGVMKEQGVNMILNIFCGPIVNAAKGIATQVNGGFQGLVSNLNIAVRPQVTKSFAQGNIERSLNLTFSISKISCLLLYIFSYPILLELDFILKIWLGNNIPDHTNSFILIVVLTSFFSNLNASVSGIVHSSGNMKAYQLTGAFINLLSLPLVFFALRSGCSPEFALWILFILMAIVQIASLIVLKSIVDYSIINYVHKIVLPVLYVMLISCLPPYLIHHFMTEGYLRLLTVGLFSIMEIAIVAYCVGLSKSEKDLITTLLVNIHNKLSSHK